MWTRTSALLALVGLALATGTAGSLDSGFGTGGVVVASNGDAGQMLGLAVQGDGKIVAVGDVASTPQTWRIRRFNVDGSADTSFDATVYVGISGGVARRVAIDSFGRIVVAGTATIQKVVKGKTTNVTVTAVVRLLSDGSLDTTFGTGGKSLTDAVSGPSGLALQADGKIVVGGGNTIARLQGSGALDTAFGSGGIVTDTIRRNSTQTLWAIAVQPSGGIVAAYRLGATNRDPALYWALRRYTSGGSVDTGFGGSGLVTSPGDGIRGIAVDSLDRIVAAGATLDAQQAYQDDGLVMRYTSNGTLDTSFGSGGQFLTGIAGIDDFHRVSVLADGRIMLLGRFGSPQNSYIARLDADGAPDTTYGGDGFGDTVVNPGADMDVDPDGNAVAGGRPSNSTDGDVTTWVLARWLAN